MKTTKFHIHSVCPMQIQHLVKQLRKPQLHRTTPPGLQAGAQTAGRHLAMGR